MAEDILFSRTDTDFRERRAYARKQISLRVSMYYDRLGLLSCKTRNLSIDGMLLDTGRVRLSKNTNVEVVLTDRGQDYSDPIRLLATVNRVRESLAALTFRNLEVSTYRRLKALLSEPRQTE